MYFHYQIIIKDKRMVFKFCIFIFMIYVAYSQLLKTSWNIQVNENQTSPWHQHGILINRGLCSWKLRQINQNIDLQLYEDNQYKNYIYMTVYLNFSINKDFPFYNGTAHAQYIRNVKTITESQKRAAQNVQVLFNNTTLVVQHNNATLIISLQPQSISPYLHILAILHLAAKIILLFVLIQNFRRDNTKLSFSLVYTIIGWELQAHLLVIKLFQSSDDSGDAYFGVFVGMFGWAATLSTLFYLPRPDMPWQQFQGLGIYLYQCTNGFLFSQDLNIFLYSISPLLQIRYNSLKNIKNSMCIQVFLLYFINIFFILYIKGCPACFLRYALNVKLCILVVLVSLLMTFILHYQLAKGPYLCLREMINGKDFNYFQDILLSEGQQIMEEACPICLQSLGDETLVQNLNLNKDGRKIGKIMRTPCGHRYHPSCMRKWLLQKNTCPLDNRQIPPLYE